MRATGARARAQLAGRHRETRVPCATELLRAAVPEVE